MLHSKPCNTGDYGATDKLQYTYAWNPLYLNETGAWKQVLCRKTSLLESSLLPFFCDAPTGRETPSPVTHSFPGEQLNCSTLSSRSQAGGFPLWSHSSAVVWFDQLLYVPFWAGSLCLLPVAQTVSQQALTTD